MPRLQRIVEFVKSDPILFSIYLLYIADQTNVSSSDSLSYLRG